MNPYVVAALTVVALFLLALSLRGIASARAAEARLQIWCQRRRILDAIEEAPELAEEQAVADALADIEMMLSAPECQSAFRLWLSFLRLDAENRAAERLGLLPPHPITPDARCPAPGDALAVVEDARRHAIAALLRRMYGSVFMVGIAVWALPRMFTGAPLSALRQAAGQAFDRPLALRLARQSATA